MRHLILLLLTCYAISSLAQSQPRNSNAAQINKANATIADVKEYYSPGKLSVINTPLVVEATVVGNDASKSLYKKIILQDITGGIEVLIDATDLYTVYPENATVRLSVKGLAISDLNGTLQLGSSENRDNTSSQVGSISQVDAGKHVTELGRTHSTSPNLTTIPALGPDNISTLVRICGLSFNNSGVTLGDIKNKKPKNQLLSDRNYNAITLRTSAYSDMAELKTPPDEGCITGIYSEYKGSKQIVLGNAGGLQFPAPRVYSNDGIEETALTITDLRKFGADKTLPANSYIIGSVISDRSSGTTDSRNLIVQDDLAGIAFRFTTDHKFDIDDKVKVAVGTLEITTYKGLLQIANIDPSAVLILSKAQPVTPQTVSLKSLLNNPEQYESTLVKLEDITLAGAGSTFAPTLAINQADSKFATYTHPNSQLANLAYTTSAVDIIGYVSQHDDYQLIFRNASEIEHAISTGPNPAILQVPLSKLTVDFSQLRDGDPVSLPGWTNYSTYPRGRTWQVKADKDNFYAQASAYNDPADKMETWLITPRLNFDAQLLLSFESATAYYKHDGLELLISTNWQSGSDPSAATWQISSAPLATGTSPENEWMPAYKVDLSAFCGTGFIAWRYSGDGKKSTSTFRVDNIVLETQ